MEGCPSCRADDAVLGHGIAYARFDSFPVNPGYLLILPRRHVSGFFDTTTAERKALLEERFHPDGYNVGIDIGEAAGQTIMHLHLIPRYRGDVAEPRGGVRGVIPARQ